MTGTLDYLEAQTENVITYDGLKEKTDKLISDAMSKVTEKKESLSGMSTLVEEQIAAAGVEINRVTGEMPAKVAELSAETEKLIEEAVGNLPFWGSEEHLHQVTLANDTFLEHGDVVAATFPATVKKCSPVAWHLAYGHAATHVQLLVRKTVTSTPG